MASVVIQKRERKKGHSYVVTYRDPLTHKSKYYKTCIKYRDAQRIAGELRDLIDGGGVPKIKEPKESSKLITFDELSENQRKIWIDRFKRNDLRPDTFNGYLIILNAILKTFGRRLICDISKEDLLNYQEKLFIESSAVTANRYLFIIKQIFKNGIEQKVVQTDIAASVRYLSEKAHERNNFLMPNEVIKLVDASEKTRAKYYMPALIYLGAEHGASRQEALSLIWSKIDFDYLDRGLITLFRNKNVRERTEFLMPRTRQALLEWKSHLEWMRRRKNVELKDTRFVFCRLNGERIKRFDKAWKRTCEIAKIKDFHYHDLRHTFCSNLLLSGSDLKDVKEMIGHADLAMTDRYSHLTLKHKLLNQEKLAKHYEKAI